MAEQACAALHDRQAQLPGAYSRLGAKLPRTARTSSKACACCARPCRRRCPGIARRPPHRHQHAAVRRAAHRCRPGCAASASSSSASETTTQPVGRKRRWMPRARAAGRPCAAMASNSGCSGDRGPAVLHRVGVQGRDRSSRPEQRFERGRGLPDALDQRALARPAHRLAQQPGEQPDARHRLAQIVAGRGDEAALGGVGLLERPGALAHGAARARRWRPDARASRRPRAAPAWP